MTTNYKMPMPNAIATYDHRYWLRERFVEGQRANPKWSLRAFALQLGISASTLSELLSDKRSLTPKMAERLARRLKLTDVQTQLFLRSATLSKLRRAIPADDQINQITDRGFTEIDAERFKFISHWYHLAVLNLIETKSPAPVDWIAKRLGLTSVQTEDALRRLEKLGLVVRKRRYVVGTAKPLSILTEGYEPAVQQFIQQCLRKAEHSVAHDPAEVRELSTMTMAIDPQNLPKARDAIKRFRRELCELLERGNKTRVYAFSVQLFPLDCEESK